MSLGPGHQLGDYRIISRLGAGAYGTVFEAEHIITRRHDAIKVLSDSRLRIPEEEERFLREIRVQASLHHPNIAAVHHAFWTPHGLALVMERAPGGPLSALLSRRRLPLADGMRIIMQVLSGLGYAHGQRVVHRDIKPENIIVASDGSIKITDFGLARSSASPRITQSGAAAGSPCYMSPEQALGTIAVDSRSDTYSAGVVLYEIVTGRIPFEGDSAFTVMLAHQNATPTPPVEIEPAIGPELNKVILRALEKEPARRFQNGAEFLAALEAAAQAPNTIRATHTHLMAVRAQARRKRLLVAACVCALTTFAATYSVSERAQRSAPNVATKKPAHIVPEPAPAPAPPPAEQASPVAPPEEEPAVAATDPEPEPLPAAPVQKPAKRNVPPRQKPRSVAKDDEDAPPTTPAPVLRADKPPSRSAPPVAISSTPSVSAAMPVPEAKSATAQVEEDPKAPPAKRRNVMVRAFQRVFGKHPATTPAPADTQAQPAVPRH
jgi:serine/threonine-protein kinase